MGIPDGYWAGHVINLKKNRGYGSGMGLGDTRPDYPKPHTVYPNYIPDFFIYIFLFHEPLSIGDLF
ncbi:hypothetical protein Hanom_Chr07g00607621 [Helianthus anomalus]